MKLTTLNYVKSLKGIAIDRPACSINGDNKRLVEALSLHEGVEVLTRNILEGQIPPEIP